MQYPIRARRTRNKTSLAWTITDGISVVVACTTYPSPFDYEFAIHTLPTNTDGVFALYNSLFSDRCQHLVFILLRCRLGRSLQKPQLRHWIVERVRNHLTTSLCIGPVSNWFHHPCDYSGRFEKCLNRLTKACFYVNMSEHRG